MPTTGRRPPRSVAVGCIPRVFSFVAHPWRTCSSGSPAAASSTKDARAATGRLLGHRVPAGVAGHRRHLLRVAGALPCRHRSRPRALRRLRRSRTTCDHRHADRGRRIDLPRACVLRLAEGVRRDDRHTAPGARCPRRPPRLRRAPARHDLHRAAGRPGPLRHRAFGGGRARCHRRRGPGRTGVCHTHLRLLGATGERQRVRAPLPARPDPHVLVLRRVLPGIATARSDRLARPADSGVARRRAVSGTDDRASHRAGGPRPRRLSPAVGRRWLVVGRAGVSSTAGAMTMTSAVLGLRIIPLPLGENGWRLVERNYVVFRRSWPVFLTGFLEPVFYLLSIGLGVSRLVPEFTGSNGQPIRYTDYIAPALLATSAMNGAIFDSTYNVFFKLKYAKLYDAILATSPAEK